MKKFAFLLLVFALCISLAAPAYAENPNFGEDTGIIDAAALDELIEKYASNYPANVDGRFSVGLIYTETGDSYYYNGDAWYYSGSVYKVPVCMLLAEEVAAGRLAPDTVIENKQRGSYDVSYLEYTAIVNSDNNSGHAVVDYFGGTFSGKCTDQLIKYTRLDESYFTDLNFYENSYYSARFICEVLNTLYTEPERFPNIIDLMLLSMNGHYIKAGVPEYQVAQKYGALVDSAGTDWNNCCGIIYTEHPIIISVMTRNVGGYEKFIADISRIVTDYAVSLDEELPAWLAAHAPEEPASIEEGSETESPADDTDAEPAESENPVETPAPSAAPAEKPVIVGGSGSFAFYAVPVLAVISLIVYIVSAFMPSKKRRDD